jgi:ribonuclease HI
MNLDIYTDGGAFHAHPFAAWAFIFPDIHPDDLNLCAGRYLRRSGLLNESTNNGGEIMAVAFALEFVADNIGRLPLLKSITVYSDCDRPVDAINGLLEQWANNGWRTLKPAKQRVNAQGKRGLSERDKWIFLYAQTKRIEAFNVEINAVKIPGHSGIYWNEKCDALVKHKLAVAASSLR